VGKVDWAESWLDILNGVSGVGGVGGVASVFLSKESGDSFEWVVE